MENPFLIELRLRGEPKIISKKLIFDIYKKFRVRGVVRKRPVPHVSLFGPFYSKSIYEVKQVIKKIGDDYSQFNYEISGFDYFEQKKGFLGLKKRKHVIYLKIKPDSNLQKFRHRLAKELIKKTRTQKHDHDSESDFKFHATLAMKDIHEKFDDIWEYLKNYPIQTMGVCSRITLLNKGRIICEYDFVQKKILSRREAMSKHSWRITERLLHN